MKNHNILIYLLIFILLTVNLAAFSFAKFLKKVQINDDSGIAKLNVKFSSTDEDIKELKFNNNNFTGNYRFNILALSETTLNYDIILSNLPDNLNVSLDNKTFKISQNNKVEFLNAGQILGSKDEINKENTIYFTYPSQNTAFENKIKIDIRFNQNEPNISYNSSIVKNVYAKYITSISKEITIKIPVAEVSYEDWFVTYQNEPKVLIRTQKKFLPVGTKATRDDVTKSGDYHRIDLTQAYFYNGNGSNDIIVSKDKQKNILKRYCGGNMDVNVYTPSDAEKYPHQFSASDYEKNDYEYRYLQNIVHFDIDIGDGRYSAKNVVDQGDYTQFYYGDKVKIKIDTIKEGFLLNSIYWNVWGFPHEEMTENNNEYVRVFKESPLSPDKIPLEQGIHIETKFKNYNITYNLNGGKETTPLKRTYTVQDSYLIPSATYEGLGFEMWINEQTNQRLDKIEKGSTGDLFLKANYSKELVPVYCETWYADFNKNPLSFYSTSPVIKYFAPGATVSGEEWNDEIQYLRYLKSTSIVVDKKKKNVVYRLFWANHFASSFGRSGTIRASRLLANVDFVDKDGKIIKQMENWEIKQDGWKIITKEFGDNWMPCGCRKKKVFNVTSDNSNFTVFAYSDPGGDVIIDDNPTKIYIDHLRHVRIWNQGKFKRIDSYDKSIYGNEINIYFDVTKPNENTITMKDWDMYLLPIYTKIKFNRIEYNKEKYVIFNGESGYQFYPKFNLLQSRLKQNLSWNETLSLEQQVLTNGIEFGQNAYGVRFNPNGATLDKDKDTIQGTMQNEFIPNYGADSDRKITKNTYKDDYRIFLGWSRDKNAKVPEFTDEAILPKNLFKPCSVGDLYAVWGEKTSAKQNAFFDKEEDYETSLDVNENKIEVTNNSKENITNDITNDVTNNIKKENKISSETNSINDSNTLEEEINIICNNITSNTNTTNVTNDKKIDNGTNDKENTKNTNDN